MEKKLTIHKLGLFEESCSFTNQETFNLFSILNIFGSFYSN